MTQEKTSITYGLIEELLAYKDCLEYAWTILANVSGGDWNKQSTEWEKAVENFRAKYFKLLDSPTNISPTNMKKENLNKFDLVKIKTRENRTYVGYITDLDEDNLEIITTELYTRPDPKNLEPTIAGLTEDKGNLVYSRFIKAIASYDQVELLEKSPFIYKESV